LAALSTPYTYVPPNLFRIYQNQKAIGAGKLRKLNFSPSFSITENTALAGSPPVPNNSYDIEIGSIPPSSILSVPVSALPSIPQSLLPANVVYNNQNNNFGSFYEDLHEIAKPANPASGTRRLYVDSTTHSISSLDSSGNSYNLEPQSLVGTALPYVNKGRYGTYQNLDTTPVGEGLLKFLTLTTGTGTPAYVFQTNYGPGVQFPSGATIANYGGFRSTNQIAMTGANPIIRCKVEISSNSLSRLKFGFTDTLAINDNFNTCLNNMNGYMVGFDSGSTAYSVITNNGGAGQTNITTSMPNLVTAGSAVVFSLAYNAGILTYSIQTGTSTVTTGTTSATLPASTVALYLFCTCQTNTTAAKTLTIQNVEILLQDEFIF
jgi:hypothetical protein